MTMHSPADTVLRSGKSLGVHIIVALLLYTFETILLNDFATASDTLREQYEETEVLQLLDGAQSAFVSWYIAALAVSWVCSTAFLLAANLKRADVRSHSDARKAMPAWITLFVVTLAAAAILWWRQVAHADVSALLLHNAYLQLVTVGYVGVLLAFWIACGLAVALTLKPSVPMAAAILPKFWN
jgi:hypothetical protein